MRVIGLCGQSGSGKGVVCSFFEQLGVKCIDTDRVYHDIISVNSDCTIELIREFGDSISNGCGIDRKKLREVAFKSDENLRKINEITHKHILDNVRNTIEQLKRENTAIGIIVDAPLLFESGFDKECEATLAIISDLDTKIKRIINRDGITHDMALARISSQISDKVLADKCTYTLVNNSTPDELQDKVKKLKSIIFD